MLQHYEAEEYLIGLALNYQDCAEKLAMLPEDAFSFDETQDAFRAIKGLLAQHKTPTMINVAAKLPPDKLKVRQLIMQAPSIAFQPTLFRQYEQIVLDMRRRRKIKAACMRVAGLVDDNTEDIDNLAGTLTEAVNDNGNKPQSISMGEAVDAFMDSLNQEVTSTYTGLAGLDRITGGLQDGTLNVLGARPKVGKTALALSMAMHVARKHGPVLIVSLEMTPKEILTRMFASESGIDMQKIVTRNMDADEYTKLYESITEMYESKVRFSTAQTPLQVRREAAVMQRNGGLRMIMIDYIQLLRCDEPKKSRYEEVGSITRELKLMAMDLNVPILALTQFNRESEANGVRRKPSMAEARDSGSIEQDCNMFLIQYPPPEPKAGSDLYEFWSACERMGTELQMLEIAANRQGPTGTVLMQFDKRHMKFTTLRKGDD